MEFIRPDTKINFLGKKKIFLTISGILVLASLVLVFTRGLNYGIDFRGGLELQYQFEHAVDISRVRQALADAGEGNAVVQKVHSEDTYEYIISFQLEEEQLKGKSEHINTVFQSAFPDENVILRKVDSVGPRVGADLKKAAILSMLYAVFLILGYLWFRFNITFSPAAVVALLHDVLFTLGVLVLLQVEFSLSVVAALLTIVGYSLNDTIVIFDRVRDNLVHVGKFSLENIMNRSINECLSRTLLTSFTTFLVLVVLILMGGPTLYPFAITMAIGVVVGTYSTIYIASPCAVMVDAYLAQRKERVKSHKPAPARTK